jgi:hypothetical protein
MRSSPYRKMVWRCSASLISRPASTDADSQSASGMRTTSGGFAHEIRKIRNCVHPGVWARERSEPLRFTKGVYRVVYQVFDVANSWLLHRVEKSLLRDTATKRKQPGAPSAPRLERTCSRASVRQKPTRHPQCLLAAVRYRIIQFILLGTAAVAFFGGVGVSEAGLNPLLLGGAAPFVTRTIMKPR